MIKPFVEKLENSIKEGLPGIEAHRKVTPKHRMPIDYDPNPENAKQSAVLILCFEKEGKIHTSLFKRTIDNSPHSGQISFPGGKFEDSDLDLKKTALRETEEELGINQQLVSVLAPITPIYIPVSNFSVQPVIGYMHEMPKYKPNPQEVHEVITVSFDHLFDPKNHFIKRFERNQYSFDARCIDVDGHTVWGATAIILAEMEVIYRRAIDQTKN